ncbi:MAG: hypothetical protein MSA04_08640, partial [Clostridiales bacterium]|nr:hypothetical protein [Clostridiales bacterium]
SSFLLSRVFCHVPDEPLQPLSRFCRNLATIHRRYGYYIPSSGLRGKHVCKKINERFVPQISRPAALRTALNPQDSFRFRHVRRISSFLDILKSQAALDFPCSRQRLQKSVADHFQSWYNVHNHIDARAQRRAERIL